MCARSIFRTGKKCWGRTLFPPFLITALPFPLSCSLSTIITAINYESFHGWTERLRRAKEREKEWERETNAFHRFIILKWLPWQESPACIWCCLFTYESRRFHFLFINSGCYPVERVGGGGHAFRNYFHIIATNSNNADNREFVWPLNLKPEPFFQCGLCGIEQPLKDTWQQNEFLGKWGQIPRVVHCQTAVKRGFIQRMWNRNEQPGIHFYVLSYAIEGMHISAIKVKKLS